MYAVYADGNGDITIARLNMDTLDVEKVWRTGKQKRMYTSIKILNR